jgi:hypothetical protein
MDRRNSVIFTGSYNNVVDSMELPCPSVSSRYNISMIIPLVQKEPKPS